MLTLRKWHLDVAGKRTCPVAAARLAGAGRILAQRMLLGAGRLPADALLLSETLKRHKQAYYQRIEDVEKYGDYESWVAFFCDCVAEAADYTLGRLQG